MNTVHIHSFSKWGDRWVSPTILDRLISEGSVHALTDDKGSTSYFFKHVKQAITQRKRREVFTSLKTNKVKAK